MSEMIPNTFTSYNLSEQEELQGSIFTSLQLQVLQNALASVAEEKINLEYDPKHPEVFLQKEAGLQGQLATYNYLIDKSLASVEEINLQLQSSNS